MKFDRQKKDSIDEKKASWELEKEKKNRDEEIRKGEREVAV